MNDNRISFLEVASAYLGHRFGLGSRHLGKGGRPNKVLDSIIQNTQSLGRKDLDSWVKARQRAINQEAPRRDLLLKLYNDVRLDSHISGIWENGRLNKLLALEYRILDVKAGESDEELTALFNASWFFEFMELCLESKLYGHSLIEFGQIEQDKVSGLTVIPRQHVVPEFGVYLKNPSDSKGIAYRDTPLMDYIVEVGKPKDLGLLLKAAPHFLYKKNASIAWSEYTELFGMPMRIGKINGKDKQALDRMESLLRDLGSASYAAFQEGEEVEFIESTRGDAYKVYDKLLERSNSELSKLFVGQTMTTEVGKNGSRAQGEVHERVLDDVTASDRRFIEAIVNDKLFPMLQKHGWKLEGKRFEYPEMKGIDILWNRAIAMAPHAMLDIDWMNEKFDIKLVEQKLTKNDVESGKKPKSDLSRKLFKSVDEIYEGHLHE